MAKFHLSQDGSARPCRATSKCPLGEDASHGDFADQGEASRWAEDELQKEFSARVKAARVKRRVETALAGHDAHWEHIPAREVTTASQELLDGATVDNYEGVFEAHKAMVNAGRRSALDLDAYREMATSTMGARRASVDVFALITAT